MDTGAGPNVLENRKNPFTLKGFEPLHRATYYLVAMPTTLSRLPILAQLIKIFLNVYK